MVKYWIIRFLKKLRGLTLCSFCNSESIGTSPRYGGAQYCENHRYGFNYWDHFFTKEADSDGWVIYRNKDEVVICAEPLIESMILDNMPPGSLVPVTFDKDMNIVSVDLARIPIS